MKKKLHIFKLNIGLDLSDDEYFMIFFCQYRSFTLLTLQNLVLVLPDVVLIYQSLDFLQYYLADSISIEIVLMRFQALACCNNVVSKQSIYLYIAKSGRVLFRISPKSNDFNNVELGQKVGPKISSGSTVRQIYKNSTINNLCMIFWYVSEYARARTSSINKLASRNLYV